MANLRTYFTKEALITRRSKVQVLSPQPNEENSTEKVLFFSFEYEREGLEPEKARAGVQSAGGTLGSERSEPAEG